MLLGSRRDRLVLRREPVPPPGAEAPSTFVCPACDVVLWDGVVYSTCPVCDLPVDWVDLSIPVWCCSGCDLMINEQRTEHPRCDACALPLVRIEALEHPPVEEPRGPPPRELGPFWGAVLEGFFLLLLIGAVCGPMLSLALDPQWRLLVLALMTPLLIVPLTMAGIFLWSLGTSLRELRDLARDRRTRVIHGLEHAAAKVLAAEGSIVRGGLTHEGRFELHLYREGKEEDQTKVVREAVKAAVRRIRSGERGLAYHPQCGTSMLVTVLLVALLALSSAVVGLFLDLRPQVLLALGGIYVGVLLVAARPLGLLAQRLLTVSTSFRSARVLRVVRSLNPDGDDACFDVYFNVRL